MPDPVPVRRPIVRSRLQLEPLEDRAVPAYGFDPTFGDGGRLVLTDVGGTQTTAAIDVAPLADGRLLALVHDANGAPAGLVRLNPDGTSDLAFGTNGIASGPSDWIMRAFAVQPDGKIVAAGTLTKLVASEVPGFGMVRESHGFTAFRFTLDGQPDPTFGNGGQADIEFEDLTATQLHDLAVGPDGSVVMVGLSLKNTAPGGIGWAVARLTSDGRPDPSFDGDGRAMVVWLSAVFGTRPRAVSVAADGKVLIGGELPAGYVSTGGDYGVGPGDAVVVRLNPDGSPDRTFDGDGVKTFGLAVPGTLSSSNVRELAVLPDGRVVTAGFWTVSTPVPGPVPMDTQTVTLVVARLNPDGSFDAAFGEDGRRGLPALTRNGSDEIGLGLLPGGRVLVAGAGPPDSADLDFLATALRADGSTDTEFTDGAGYLRVPFNLDEWAEDSPHAATVLPDGRVVLVGYAHARAGVRAPREAGTFDLAAVVLTDGGLPTETLPELPAPPFPPVPPSDPPQEPPAPPEPPGAPGGVPFDGPLPVPPVVRLHADMDGDGFNDAAAAAGPHGTLVRVVSGRDGSVLLDGFLPYEASFTGGIRVLLADLDRDGRAEVVTAPNNGGSARIQVFAFAGGTLVQRDNFFAFPDDPGHRTGATVAVGDVNGDGRPELIVGAGGGPRVAVFDGRRLLANAADPARLAADFFAFDPADFLGGVNVATADTDYDGLADVVAGAGHGGGPHVRVFAGAELRTGSSAPPRLDGFYGEDLSTRDGVDLAADLAVGLRPVLGPDGRLVLRPPPPPS